MKTREKTRTPRTAPLLELDRLQRKGRYQEAIDLLTRLAAELRTKTPAA